jgi:hypothetical protein
MWSLWGKLEGQALWPRPSLMPTGQSICLQASFSLLPGTSGRLHVELTPLFSDGRWRLRVKDLER